MILQWASLRQDNPLAVQVIEKETGFTYEAAYGTLLKENKQILYSNLENFFDSWGWRMTVAAAEYPAWTLMITDRNDNVIFNMPATDSLKSRDHAKSTLAGVAITYLNQWLADLFKLEGNELILDRSYLQPDAENKPLGSLSPSDFTLDGQGLISAHDIALYQVNDDYVVLKNALGKLPFPGMILSFPK
jgi:hypothetical protein